MKRPGRTYALLLGVAASGGLVWAATQIDGTSAGRYWARLGVLAGAGLVLALVQRTAYGAWREMGVLAFLLAFLPAAAVTVWVAIDAQPEANWFRDHVSSWSGSIGVGSPTGDLIRYTGVLAFGLGVVTGSVPILSRRREPVEPEAAQPAAAEPPPEAVPAAAGTTAVREPTTVQEPAPPAEGTTAADEPTTVREPAPPAEGAPPAEPGTEGEQTERIGDPAATSDQTERIGEPAGR
jgi:hypothetical protein